MEAHTRQGPVVSNSLFCLTDEVERGVSLCSRFAGYRVDHAIKDALKRDEGDGSGDPEEEIDPRLKGLDPEVSWSLSKKEVSNTFDSAY